LGSVFFFIFPENIANYTKKKELFSLIMQRTLPRFPNIGSFALNKSDIAELHPNIQLLSEKNEPEIATEDNIHLFTQKNPKWSRFRKVIKLLISASAVSNLLGMFDSETAIRLDAIGKKKAYMHKLSGTDNEHWDKVRFQYHYTHPNSEDDTIMPEKEPGLTMSVFTTGGVLQEDLVLMWHAATFPDATLIEKGLTKYVPDERVLTNYLTSDKRHFDELSFKIFASPDIVIMSGEADAKKRKTIDSFFGNNTNQPKRVKQNGEYKIPTSWIPDNKSLFNCYEFQYVQRKPWDRLPEYYYLQTQWQMLVEGTDTNYLICYTLEKGVNVFEIKFNRRILSLAVTLCDHVVKTFITPTDPSQKHRAVPTNYFTQTTDKVNDIEVAELHRQLIDQIVAVCAQMVPEYHPPSTVRNGLSTAFATIHPDRKMPMPVSFATMPHIPACYPRFAACFIYRLALCVEEDFETQIELWRVTEPEEVDKRSDTVDRLLQIPCLSFLSGVVLHIKRQCTAKTRHVLYNIVTNEDDSEKIKMLYYMDRFKQIESVIAPFADRLYRLRHPTGEFNPSARSVSTPEAMDELLPELVKMQGYMGLLEMKQRLALAADNPMIAVYHSAIQNIPSDSHQAILLFAYIMTLDILGL